MDVTTAILGSVRPSFVVALAAFAVGYAVGRRKYDNVGAHVTANRFREATTQLMVDRTAFVIAHRSSTVVNADRIIVLEAGKVAAQGTHEELMRSSDLYKRLYARQFQEVLKSIDFGIPHSELRGSTIRSRMGESTSAVNAVRAR